jgi:hypothetical protein
MRIVWKSIDSELVALKASITSSATSSETSEFGVFARWSLAGGATNHGRKLPPVL